jgi:alpha-beta hydrolase superfamily lysophospholipase
VADAAAITAPILLLISGDDWVVHRVPQEDFFARLGSSVKEKIVLDGFYRDTLGERDRAKAVAQVRGFILRELKYAAAARRIRGRRPVSAAAAP